MKQGSRHGQIDSREMFAFRHLISTIRFYYKVSLLKKFRLLANTSRLQKMLTGNGSKKSNHFFPPSLKNSHQERAKYSNQYAIMAR